MSAPSSTAVKAVQILSVPTAAMLSGLIACMSYAAIPAVGLASTDVAPRQWKRIYDIGVVTAPPMVIGAAAGFAWLSYSTSRLPGLYPSASFDFTAPSALYATATVLLPSIVPFTILVMNPTNNELTRRATRGDKIKSEITPAPANEDAAVGGLLKKWQTLNYVRAGLVLTGTLLAMTATVLSP